MSLLHAIHFDAGVLPACIQAVGAGAANAHSRTGSYAGRVYQVYGEYSNYLTFTLSSVQSEVYLQFGFYYAGVLRGGSTYSGVLRWKSSAGNILGTMRWVDASGCLNTYTGNNATLVGSGVTPINPAGTWFVIEAHIKIDSSSGIIDVRVDGVPDSSFTGNTKPGADTSIYSFDFGYIFADSSSGYCTYYDDIIVNTPSGSYNNSWPNSARVYYILPTSDGVSNQWAPTPAGLTHFSTINDVPVSATQNIAAGSTGLIDIFNMGTLPSTAGTIKAVIPEVYAFKGSTEPPSRLGIGIDVGGGVEYVDKDLALSETQYVNIWEQKPGGGNFTATDVNSIKLYLKSET